MRSDLVDVTLIYVHQTDKAWLFKETEKSDPIWLAKSIVEVHETKKSGIYEVTMPEHVAQEKGLI